MMNRPVDDAGDAETLRDLRHLWAALDPMPADLPGRVLLALNAESGDPDVDLDIELLLLVAQADRTRGVRTAEVTLDTMTFAGPSLEVMIRVSVHAGGRRRLDGWLTPTTPMRLTVHHAEGGCESLVDTRGRFVVEDVPAGLTRIRLTPTEPAPVKSYVTPSIEI